MIVLITGGSGSGKSEYGENLALKLNRKTHVLREGLNYRSVRLPKMYKYNFTRRTPSINKIEKMTYIATMYPYGEETLQKIERHKKMRAGKGFETIECFSGLKNINEAIHSTVLLECMSNLLANELYLDEGSKDKVFEEIIVGVRMIASKADDLIIISNDVFSDGAELDKEMTKYIKLLGSINREIAQMADVVCEVVYSIPVFQKIVNPEGFPYL